MPIEYTPEADVVYKHIKSVFDLWNKSGRSTADFISGLDQVRNDIPAMEHKYKMAAEYEQLIKTKLEPAK
jgi:hypothetical protein